MADKYLIHGATYCGTGTSSAEATSDGGTGAWNDINVLEGTAPAYGSAPAAGDTVYIRSKTSAGADITRTLSASITLGSTAGTPTSPVTWVLDAGTVWPGISGTLTYSCPSNFVVNARDNSRFWSESEDKFVLLEASASASYKNYFGGSNLHVRNILYDFSGITSGNGSQIGNLSGVSHLENVHIKSRKRPECLIRGASYSKLLISNPYIELLDASETRIVFSVIGSGCSMEVIGGAMVGVGATTGVPVTNNIPQGSVLRMAGFVFPQTMSLANYPAHPETQIIVTGSDGLTGSRVMAKWGESNSRTDAYYPTLNVTLPDSTNTPWSWWFYPKYAATNSPMHQVFAKVYSEAAAIKVIDLEVLVATTFSGITGGTLWFSVSYTDDSTGLPKRLCSHNNSALDTSTAGWSATTYGATSYNKRRLRVTTPTAIKQDSLITVTLYCTVSSGSANDTLVVCPDFVLSAP